MLMVRSPRLVPKLDRVADDLHARRNGHLRRAAEAKLDFSRGVDGRTTRVQRTTASRRLVLPASVIRSASSLSGESPKWARL
jgi:hypothetical protein